MKAFDYIIVGGGMTAAAAAAGIREADSSGTIALFSSENDRPYDRPPLSKSLWKDKSVEDIWLDDATASVELFLGCTIAEVRCASRSVVDIFGRTYQYGKLLLATGGSPRQLGMKNDAVHFRTLADYQRLRKLSATKGHFGVIGGGFIGSELAAALTMNGCKVTMVFPGPHICARALPASLAEFVSEVYRKRGVELLPGQKVVGYQAKGGQRVLTTDKGVSVAVDGAVVGVGLVPNTELAAKAGLLTDDGIVVGETLRTSDLHVYAAGDVASFYNPTLGQRMRVEHEDNAKRMGQQAGRNMAGNEEPYHHLPSFYSDLFEYGYEAVGLIDARLETVIDWKRRHEEGVIYYLDKGRVRGVLLWNVWSQLKRAREIIAMPGPFSANELKGLLAIP